MSAFGKGADNGGETVDRLVRHRLADRIFHWVMAASVLTLLGTGLFPILGVKFPWVLPHWIAGIVLTAALLFHIPRALIWLDRASMVIGPRDIRQAWHGLRWNLRLTDEDPAKPGKYPLLQRLYHHGTAAVVLVAVGTGLVMMKKIDTPLWKRDPYWLSSDTWGWIYVAHGVCTLVLITIIMVHVYFAVRPDKLWITRSMILGWITRTEYAEHHDPDRWSLPEEQE